MAESLEDFLKGFGKVEKELNKIATTPIGKVLQDFSQEVVFTSQANLEEAGHNASGSLGQSLTPEITEDASKITAELYANDYWEFINYGVNGIERNFGAPFSFKYIRPSKSMIDSFMGLDKQNWMASKGITSLTSYKEDGTMVVKQLVTDEDYKSAAYAFATGTKKKGIQPTYYISSIFTEERMEKLQNDLGDKLIDIIWR